MNIVVLDGHTLSSGDLFWGKLHVLGQCAINERTRAAQIPEHTADAEIVLTNKASRSAEPIARLTRLRYVGVLATGYNNDPANIKSVCAEFNMTMSDGRPEAFVLPDPSNVNR